jgi:hypothetical protein
VLALLCAPHVAARRQLRPGTPLDVRLTTPIGSSYSKRGAPVHASLSVPIELDGRTLLPTGTRVSGTVKSVRRVGLGLVHETSALDLEFTEIAPPSREPMRLAARVVHVDNARERVGKSGRIHGNRPTSTMIYRGSRYLTALVLLGSQAQGIKWLTRSLIAHVPDPEIYYPAGSDLTLELAAPLEVEDAGPAEALPTLTVEERRELHDSVRALPPRSVAPSSGRPSDWINLVFLGSREQLDSAFGAAGWEGADPITRRSAWRSIRAVASGEGYPQAPVSLLLWRDAPPDMVWQRGLNTLAKRHHVRVWKSPDVWNERDVWLGAATRDVAIRFFRAGQKAVHLVDENIDLERAKVVNDLKLSGCVAATDWLERQHDDRKADTKTVTDARLAVVSLQDCTVPTADPGDGGPPRAGRVYRMVRRQILSARNDLMRGNLYWKSFEGFRSLLRVLRPARRLPVAAPPEGAVAEVPEPAAPTPAESTGPPAAAEPVAPASR